MKYLNGIKINITVLIMLFAGNANASIILTNVGNDLLIEIENSITFEVTSNVSTTRIGFKLPGAVSISGSGGFQLTTVLATAPTLSGDSFFTGVPDVALMRGGPDLEILYFLSDTINLSIGDKVTLSKGEIVLPNFFDFSVINGLNFTVSTEAVLSRTSGVVISDSTLTAVPIPSALLLFSSAMIIFGATVRHRK